MNSHRYDCIVVGAGPAGASTALYAARAGLDVLVLDKHRFPRDKICGDAVARKSVSHLRELGVLDRVELSPHEPVSRAVLSSPNGRTIAVDLSTRDEPAPHLVCRREILDAVLVDAVRRQARLVEDAAVTDIVQRSGCVTGVTYRSDGAEREAHARVVIGADGFDSIVARRLGTYRHDSSRWYVATRGYYRGLDVDARTVEVHFFEEALPGFLWVFPTGDGIANVGLGVVHRSLKRRRIGLRALHESVLEHPRLRARFRAAERIGPVRGWNLPTPDASRTIAGAGYLLAGDAAGLVDPFSGEGIGNAMDSGRVAAEIAAEAAATNDAVAPLERYPARLWDTIDATEISLHYRLRGVARHGRLIDFLIGQAAAHPDVLEWIRSMTGPDDTVDRKRRLLSPLTYARLLVHRK
jgi:geranylgeranyl reductase family protein